MVRSGGEHYYLISKLLNHSALTDGRADFDSVSHSMSDSQWMIQ